MLSSVHLVQGEEALQGEVGVELLDLAAVGHYDPGRTSCRDDPDTVLAQLVTGSPDQGVDRAGVAVDETAADGVRSIGGYDPRRCFFEVHARKLGRFGDERVQRNVEACQYGASEVACFAVYGLDGRRRTDIDDDRREPVMPPCRHGVDDPVGPDCLGVVVAVVETGLHLRGHPVVGYPEDPGGEVTIGTGETGHDAGDYHRAHLVRAQTFEREKPREEDGELVGRPVRLRGDTPLAPRLLAINEPQDSLRIPYVHSHQQSSSASPNVRIPPSCTLSISSLTVPRCGIYRSTSMSASPLRLKARVTPACGTRRSGSMMVSSPNRSTSISTVRGTFSPAPPRSRPSAASTPWQKRSNSMAVTPHSSSTTQFR